jgi:hypothetical protein
MNKSQIKNNILIKGEMMIWVLLETLLILRE